MWNLPGPGVEPVSPALAGRFLTTGPPGKSSCLCFIILILIMRKLSLTVLTCAWSLLLSGRNGMWWAVSQATITNYQRLDDLDHIYFPQFWRLKVHDLIPGVGSLPGWQMSVLPASSGGGESGHCSCLRWHSSHSWGLHPHDLTMFQSHCLQIPSYSGLGTQCIDLEGGT